MNLFRLAGFASLVLVASSSFAMAQDYVPRRYREAAPPQPVRHEVSQAVQASYFAGSWGQVSFNTEADIPKMRGVARQYCGALAVPIRTASPTSFMMYVTTNLKEVQVIDQGGQQFIIPVEQFNDGVIREARALKVIDQNAFTLRYLDEGAHSRYGDNIFVRCGSRDPKPQKEASADNAANDKPRKARRTKRK